MLGSIFSLTLIFLWSSGAWGQTLNLAMEVINGKQVCYTYTHRSGEERPICFQDENHEESLPIILKACSSGCGPDVTEYEGSTSKSLTEDGVVMTFRYLAENLYDGVEDNFRFSVFSSFRDRFGGASSDYLLMNETESLNQSFNTNNWSSPNLRGGISGLYGIQTVSGSYVRPYSRVCFPECL